MNREELGRRVRRAWIDFWESQPDREWLRSKHPNWFEPWEELSDREREVDRSIGEALYQEGWTGAVGEGLTVSEGAPEAAVEDQPRLKPAGDRPHGIPDGVLEVIAGPWAPKYVRLRYIASWKRLADNAIAFVLTNGDARILDLHDAQRLGLRAAGEWPDEAEQLAHKAWGAKTRRKPTDQAAGRSHGNPDGSKNPVPEGARR